MNKKYYTWLLIVIVLLFISFLATGFSLSIGELKISLFKIPKLLSDSNESIESVILRNIRLPRVLLGLSVGGSLSLAGVVLQGIYRNPLVEPYTLGISGGAALGVAITIVFGLHLSIVSLMVPFAGFIGALLTVFLVYTLSVKKGKIRIQSMLLIGVMISFVASSSMMFLMAITTSENLHGIIFWIMGSLDEPNANLICITIVISLLSLIYLSNNL